MAKIQKNLINFFSKLEISVEGKRARRERLKRIPLSTSYMQPGEVLFFIYEGEDVVVLVVSSDRGHGTFVSTRRNLLMTCFKLEGSQVILRQIIRKLYKRRRISNYHNIKSGLSSLLGKTAFRTYMVRKIQGLHTINFNRDEF